MTKVRIGIIFLIAGEVVTLVTQAWRGPLAFLTFAGFGSGLVLLGMIFATRGVIQRARESSTCSLRTHAGDDYD